MPKIAIPRSVQDQIDRFLRLFLTTLIPQLVALNGHHVTRSMLIGILVGSAEVAYRLLFPVHSTLHSPVPVATVSASTSTTGGSATTIHYHLPSVVKAAAPPPTEPATPSAAVEPL